jgi:hypothetical protein
VEVWEIEARLSIQVLFSSYGRFVDSGRVEDLANLFAEPCHYELSKGTVLTDRAAIVAGVEATKAVFADAPPGFGRVRHHISSQVVDLRNPSSASASSYFMAVANYGPDHWGVYRDEIVKVGGAWLFSSRKASVQGALPHSPVAHMVDA